MDRRQFLHTLGAAAAALGGLPLRAAPLVDLPETLAARLYGSLFTAGLPGLRRPVDHPLRNDLDTWQQAAPYRVGELDRAQQELVRAILEGATSREGYRRFLRQMTDDASGLEQYHIGFFGAPSEKGFQMMLAGRHLILRVDGAFGDRIGFGGPIHYGHGEPNPRRSLWADQTRQAGELFAALDDEQRARALRQEPPLDRDLTFRTHDFPGIRIGDLSAAQRLLAERLLDLLLAPWCARQAREVLGAVARNGGIEALHCCWYSAQGRDPDGRWDIWRIEGPGFVWSFRGRPHAHGFVHVAAPRPRSAPLDDEFGPR